MDASDDSRPHGGWIRRGVQRALEPQVLFPALAVLILGVTWTTTLTLIHVERASAERAALAESRELIQTYETQVVRALREIDQTLRIVQHEFALKQRYTVLRDLTADSLMPPDLMFVVSIADAKGNLVASTRPIENASLADQDDFRMARDPNALAVGVPEKNRASGRMQIRFVRRLNAANAAFAGVVIVAVDPADFVSGYQRSELGYHGVLAVLGTDGVFRARRVGDAVFAGDAIDYASVVPPAQAPQPEAVLTTSAWDQVRRYTSARQLHDFPLALVVGLSEDEQLGGARQRVRVYLAWAAFASGLVIGVLAIIGRMSWQLAQSRARAIQAQMSHAKRVEYLAYHDTLTALPNRSLLTTLLTQGINQARRHDGRLAVLFIDLDRFKLINDTLGHDAGDRLLMDVAIRLKACLRESDVVARLGGDEFVAMLPELNDETDVATVAQKILAALARPSFLQGHEFRVTASIGISTYPRDGLDADTLIKNADGAMYQAKEHGRNTFQFHSASQACQP